MAFITFQVQDGQEKALNILSKPDSSVPDTNTLNVENNDEE